MRSKLKALFLRHGWRRRQPLLDDARGDAGIGTLFRTQGIGDSHLLRLSNCIDVVDGIQLTKVTRSDAPSLVKHLNDIEFYDNTCSIPHPYTTSDATIFINSVLDFEKEHGLQRDWAIRNPEGEQIGGIGLLYSHGMKSHRSEIGYWLAKTCWNQGIMTSVLMRFVEHIFSMTHFSRLEAQVFKGNDASCRVLEKAGFHREGLIRHAYLKEGKYLDTHLYAVLKPSSGRNSVSSL
ncbi:MAG: GNAT family N-acetyltransferase [Saprospiraceae bacterium]|nr:GNAT family N-acetyltransferase [Saprospiraceae bacterium]